MAALMVAERRRHRTWGPKKLQAVLECKHGIGQPPACSTIAGILRRHGLSVRRRRRPGAFVAGNDGLTVPTQPNHVWTVDFKGCFLLGNQQRCDPLTVCDRYSHYVLACAARPNQQFTGTRFAGCCATTVCRKSSAATWVCPSPPTGWAASPA
jgi:transposase InsO family protein